MSKILVTSDIHLDSFSSHNFYPGFRDEQFIRLANRLIEIAKQNDTKRLFIAGDLLDKPTNRSTTLHLLNKFIHIINDYFDEIYYILGQHDTDSKEIEFKSEDSVVNLFKDYTKMIYAHNKVYYFDNRKFYFKNWIKSDKVELTESDIDVFISHITLSYLFGQTVDNTKFKLGIFGDIHTPIDIENMHSITCPIQKDLRDADYGNVVIIDTQDLSWKRVQVIDDNNKFLRIYRQGFEKNVDEYTWVIPQHKKINSIKIDSIDPGNVTDVNLTDLNKVIYDYINSLGLLEIHKEISNKVNSPDPIDLNFRLISFETNNYRSIGHFEFDFEKNQGITFFSGKNGSGKSSAVESLFVSLVGDRYIRNSMKYGQSWMNTKVKLEYQNTIYEIERGSGYCNFKINDEGKNKNNKGQTEQFIYECLPFLHYLNIFYVRAKSNFFNNFFNSKLLSKLYNLEVFTQYKNLSSMRIKELNSGQAQLRSKKDQTIGKIDQTKLNIDQLNEKLSLIKLSELTQEELVAQRYSVMQLIQSLKSYDELKTRVSNMNIIDEFPGFSIEIEQGKITELESYLSKITTKLSIKSSISSTESELNKLNKSLEDKVECPECHTKFNTNNTHLNELIESTKLKLTELNEKLNELADIDTNLSGVKKTEIQRIKESIKKYNEFVAKNTEYLNLKSRVDSELSQYTSNTLKLSSILGEVLINDYYANVDQELSKYSEHKLLVRDKDNFENTIKTYEDEITVLDKEIFDIVENTKKYQTYFEIFNEGSPTSIYGKVLLKISETLSDDELSFTNKNNGDESLGFMLKVGPNWIDYGRASTGQQSYMDIKLLSKLSGLTGTIPLLILDEMLANVDVDNLEKCIELIKQVDCTNLLMTSHSPMFTDYDQAIRFELVDGTTVSCRN